MTETKQVIGLGSAPYLRCLTKPSMARLGGEGVFIVREFIQPGSVLVVQGGLAHVEAAPKRNKQGVSGVKVVTILCES